MKIADVVEALSLDLLCCGDKSREATSVISGDLMSFIIGKAKSGSIWVTVQNHLNVAAVAVLKEIPLIIVASGRPVMDDLKTRCDMEHIALAISEESSFTLCHRLYDLGFRG